MDVKKVVAFIPALDEEEKIEDLINKTREIYSDSHERGWKLEILVVDDGSTDRTAEMARKANADKIVSHPVNMGLGAATRTGLKTAFEMGADVALKLDADFQHDPQDIEKCVKPILDDEADIVWGSRFKGKINYKMPLHRHWGNRFFTWLMRKLTYPNITDAQTGLMVFSRKYLEDFRILSNYNPPQQLLIDAHSRGMRYVEAPVVFHKRKTGKSFVSFKYPFKVLPAMLWILIYANPLKVFVPLGVMFIFASIAALGYDLYPFFEGGRPDTVVTHDTTILLLFSFGAQLIIFGLLGDMIRQRR